MLVFIDESGDAGFKFEKGSSTHFVVTLILFTDNEEALKVDNHISEIKKRTNLRSDFEFHFHKTGDKICKYFLTEISKFDFRYFGVVVNKNELQKQKFPSPQDFYNFTCGLVCQSAKNFLSQATVVIDGKKSKEFKTKLGNFLKNSLNDKESKIFYIKKVKMQDSGKNNLLQIADMVCGAVARSFKQINNAEVYREIIKDKEILVIEYAEKE